MRRKPPILCNVELHAHFPSRQGALTAVGDRPVLENILHELVEENNSIAKLIQYRPAIKATYAENRKNASKTSLSATGCAILHSQHAGTTPRAVCYSDSC